MSQNDNQVVFLLILQIDALPEGKSPKQRHIWPLTPSKKLKKVSVKLVSGNSIIISKTILKQESSDGWGWP